MALIKCPKCNHEISDTVKKCVHCGSYVKKREQVLKNNKILIVIVLIALIVFFIGHICIIKNNTFSNKQNTEDNSLEISKDNDESNIKDDNEENIPNNDESQNDKNSKKESNSVTSTTTTNNKANKNKTSTTNSVKQENTPIKDNSYKTYAYSRYVCPKGYELNGSSKICSKKVTIAAIIDKYTCSSGSTLVGTRCKTSVTKEPINGECSISSYVLEDGKCVLYNDAKVESHCPSGYKFENSVDKSLNKCSNTEYQNAQLEYYCDSGGKLDGDECVYGE